MTFFLEVCINATIKVSLMKYSLKKIPINLYIPQQVQDDMHSQISKDKECDFFYSLGKSIFFFNWNTP